MATTNPFGTPYARDTTPQSTAFPYPWSSTDECVTYTINEKVGPAWDAGACPGLPDTAHTGGAWYDAAWNRYATSDCNRTPRHRTAPPAALVRCEAARPLSACAL